MICPSHDRLLQDLKEAQAENTQLDGEIQKLSKKLADRQSRAAAAAGGGDEGAYLETVLQIRADMDKLKNENRTLKLQLHAETSNRMKVERTCRQALEEREELDSQLVRERLKLARMKVGGTSAPPGPVDKENIA